MEQIVEPGEHVCIVGEIGSGKTVLAKHIIRRMPVSKRFIFYPKSEDDDFWRGYKNAKKFESEEQLSYYLRSLLERGDYADSVIMVDDSQAILKVKGHGDYHEEIRRLILTGRKGGCTMVMVLHHARQFPLVVRMQVRHWFLFRPSLLAEPVSRDLFGDTITDLSLTLDDHEFLYIHNQKRKPELCPPVSLPKDGKPIVRRKADVVKGPEQVSPKKKGWW